MTSEQEVTDDNRKFKAKLIRLAEASGLGEGGFAVWLGYTIGHISKVKNGHLPVDRTLDLLLETLEENQSLKNDLSERRRAWATLNGEVGRDANVTEAPATLNGTASSGFVVARKQTPDEIFAAAKQKVLSQIPQAASPTSSKPKPVREKKPPASSAPPARGDQP